MGRVRPYKKRKTEQEKSEMVELYNSGKSSVEVGQMFDIHGTSVRSLLKNRGVKMRSKSEVSRKYEFRNEAFFDEIDTPLKAYFLGLLYSDGNNLPKRNRITLQLKESDRYLVEELSKLIFVNKPVTYIKSKKETWSNAYKVTIVSEHMSQQLIKWGCVPRKTYNLLFPNFLPDHPIPHFIRGHFDGDGHVGVYHYPNSGRSYKSSLEMVGTEAFCEGVKDIMLRVLGINSHIRSNNPKKDNNIKRLIICGGRQALSFLDWIYEGSTIYLKRKYKIYLKLKEIIRKVDESRICKVKKCNRKTQAKSLCRKHYKEYHRRIEQGVDPGPELVKIVSSHTRRVII